jgi:hypothetical protein
MNTKLKVTIAATLLVTAVVAGGLVARGDASSGAARVSNGGGPLISVRGLRFKFAPIKTGHVLAVRNGRVFYRLNLVNGGTCFGAGFANDVGNPGSVTCPNDSFPRAANPVLDFSVYEGLSHDLRDFALYRAEGFAADGVAAVEYLRPNGDVALRVPVAGNVYEAASVPKGPIEAIVAVDKDGRRIWRSR